MSKFKELAGIEEKDIWRNQTNLKKAFRALPQIEKMITNGEKDEELIKIHKELEKNLKHLMERDVKEAFIFANIIVYGHSSSDIFFIYGEKLEVSNAKELREIASETLKLMIACKKEGINLNEI